jgi:hypothetical protein
LNTTRTNHPDSDAILELLSSLADDCLTTADRQRLMDEMRRDPQVRAAYIEHAILQSLLMRKAHCDDLAATFLASDADSDIAPSPLAVETASHAASPAFPMLGLLVQPPHGFFSSGWPVAYLVATAIFAIGLVIGAIIHVSKPTPIVGPSTLLPSSSSPRASVVGCITGMVDCVWENQAGWVKRSAAPPRSSPEAQQTSEALKHQSSIINQQSLLHLGDRLALRSGLLEITYDTGAKVILQGPVTYEVESPTGGYLLAGKLTAKLEKKSEVRGQKSDSANQKSEIRNPKSSDLFAVRTPTAIVTDLGTEFAVEVDRKGRTTSHVFRGTVSLRTIGENTGLAEAEMILHANQSACTERIGGDASRVVMHRIAINPDGFTRHLKETSPVQVLAWFRMGEDEPNVGAGSVAGKEIHDHRNRLRLDRYGSPRYSDDTNAPGSVRSMTFHGGSDSECFRTSRFPFVPNDYFILEAWVKLHKVGSEHQLVAGSGRGAQNGYCLIVVNGRWHGVLEAIAWIDSGVACEIGKWTHLALVCERGKSQLWINGMPVGKAIDALPNMPDGRFTIGGNVGDPHGFDGEIDEVRLSTFIGPFRPEMLLLRKADLPQ